MPPSDATSSHKITPIGLAPDADSYQSLYEAQKEIYPRSVVGRFVSGRWACVWLTQILFYGLPWLMWNDRQALLFDIVSRRFYIFGLVLYPQDFIYLTALLVLCAWSLFLFTAVAGRVWCGYACPQTVYTEMFLWLEKKFEGDRSARMRRARRRRRCGASAFACMSSASRKTSAIPSSSAFLATHSEPGTTRARTPFFTLCPLR